MTSRTLERTLESVPTSDGAGVKLRRGLGQTPHARLDPFLMLDHFSTDNADDYIAGFPAHPHRGFETVTYMIDGHMRHEDHMGHVGELKSGGVQWMSAGRGVIHSEMPQQEQGRMRGFQLWLNLPANEKMKPAAYRDIPATEIPVVALPVQRQGTFWVHRSLRAPGAVVEFDRRFDLKLLADHRRYTLLHEAARRFFLLPQVNTTGCVPIG